MVDLERFVLWFILVVGGLGVLGSSRIQRTFELFNHIQNESGINLDLLGIHDVRIVLLEDLQLNLGVSRLHLAPLRDVFSVPRVRSNIRKSIPLLRIGVEYFLDQVRAIPRNVFRNGVITLQNLFVQLIRIIVLKWQVPTKHGVQDNTARPNIDLKTFVLFASNHLRCRITWATTRGLKALIRLIHVREAEIDNLDIIRSLLKQKILRLEITMTYAIFVQMFHTFHNLTKEFGRIYIIDTAILHDVVEKLAGVSMLHDEVQFTFRLDNLIQLNDPRVSNLLKNFDFSCYTVYIHLILNLILFQDFDSHFFLSNCLDSKFYFSECAFTQGLVDQKVGDLTKLSRLLLADLA